MGLRAGRRRVVIVGGGVAGLTLAVALPAEKFEVQLIEAQPGRVTGAALGLWTGARRQLQGLGIALPDAHADQRIVVHRLDGRRIVALPSPAVAQVMRPALMGALEVAVPTSVQRLQQEVTQPENLDADLVVGADGVRSRVRGLVDSAARERRETPWVALRGIVSETNPDWAGIAREYWGAGRLFGDAPVVGGRYWFTAHRSDLGPEPLDAQMVRREAQAKFQAAAGAIQTALADDSEETLATRLWTTPPMRQYTRGRYVVMGDAAHASLPNLGRGASDAILDAVSLARILSTDGSLSAWQARRLPMTQAARIGAGLGMRLATASWW